jgi:hypothetical protein
MSRLKLVLMFVLIPSTVLFAQREEPDRGWNEAWKIDRVILYQKSTGSGYVVQTRSLTDNWIFDASDTLLSTIMRVYPSMGLQLSLEAAVGTASDSIAAVIEILGAIGISGGNAPADSQFAIVGSLSHDGNNKVVYKSIVTQSTPDSVNVAGWNNVATVETPVMTHWRIRVRALPSTSATASSNRIRFRRSQYVPR